MSDSANTDTAFALGPPTARGRLRSTPEDFQVAEILPFTPDGTGEHLYLHVRKRDANTAWVAERLARLAGLSPSQVSYAGLKDRHAVAKQWFSLHLPGRDDPPWRDWQEPDFQVLAGQRHSRKLRRGALSGNRFRIVVRELTDVAPLELEDRWQRLLSGGVPNYFGPQRFGREGNNLRGALALFQGRRVKRQQRSLYLSAARAYLFNDLLSRRILDGNWCAPLPGEVAMLEGSHSVFPVEAPDITLGERLQALDLHLTGPLWGRGEPMSRGAVRALEEATMAGWPVFRDGLVAAGLAQERRALRIVLREPAFSLEGDGLTLAFQLPAGSYATAVLREMLLDGDGALSLNLPDVARGPLIDS